MHPTFGFWNPARKDYDPKAFCDTELASMTGSIAWKDNKPARPVHGVVTGKDSLLPGPTVTLSVPELVKKVFPDDDFAVGERAAVAAAYQCFTARVEHFGAGGCLDKKLLGLSENDWPCEHVAQPSKDNRYVRAVLELLYGLSLRAQRSNDNPYTNLETALSC